MENEEEDDEEEEEIPLDLEEVEAVSKKARQDEEIHSEHLLVKVLSYFQKSKGMQQAFTLFDLLDIAGFRKA